MPLTAKQKNLLEAVQKGAIKDAHSFALYQLIDMARQEIEKLEELKKSIEEAIPDILKRPDYLLDKKVETATGTAIDMLGKSLRDTVEDVRMGMEKMEGRAAEMQEMMQTKAPQEDLHACMEELRMLREQMGKKMMEMENMDHLAPIMPEMREMRARLEQIQIATVEDIDTRIEQTLPSFGDKIKTGLETLTGDDRLSKDAIKGLEDEIKRLEELVKTSKGGRTGMRRVPIVQSINLTDQCDGATKTFTLPKDTVKVLGVWGTQFPVTFDSDADFTFAGTTLTLTSEVGAPATGQTLWCLIETLFYA